jgi:hypothetical protein
MTHLIARDYRPEDFSETEFSPHEQCVIAGQPIGEWARIHGAKGPAYTVVNPDGAVVFCAGVHHFWHGTGDYSHRLPRTTWRPRRLRNTSLSWAL